MTEKTDMKKIAIITAIALLASASAFAAYPTGDYMTWFGSDAGKDVTNSSGSSFYGAWAGEGGEYINYSGFFGALSGYRAYNVNRSLGLGPWALREARNVYGTVAIGTSSGRGIEGCTNCVFIGTNAGRDCETKNGAIDIGGVFKYEGDDEDGLNIDNIKMCNLHIREILYALAGITSIKGSTPYFHGRASAAEEAISLRTGSADSSPSISWNNGTERWTASGYPGRPYGDIAYLSDLADYDRKDKTAIPITDEDTGEKYIIKVKSGALKLYKVEDTEE